ncbi:MAG: ATP-binding protein [Armatimonadetes bacterium]|nr:ATP-binding protein [Armatimonadota bacterium]
MGTNNSLAAHRARRVDGLRRKDATTLKRLYVDNYKCLVNFDLRFDRLSLLLGQNGSGKPSVLEALAKVRRFIVDQANTDSVFPHGSLTRWQESRLQRFEIEVESDEGDYTYKLVIEHEVDRNRSRVDLAELSLSGRPLFEFRQGEAQLYHDDFTQGPKHPFDWRQSGVGFPQPRHGNKKLIWFRERMARKSSARWTPSPCRLRAKARSQTPATG